MGGRENERVYGDVVWWERGQGNERDKKRATKRKKRVGWNKRGGVQRKVGERKGNEKEQGARASRKRAPEGEAWEVENRRGEPGGGPKGSSTKPRTGAQRGKEGSSGGRGVRRER